MSVQEANAVDMIDAKMLLKKFNDERIGDDIWQVQTQGIDPMKIPKFAAHIRKNEKKNKPARIPTEDAEIYHNVFDTALKGIKHG